MKRKPVSLRKRLWGALRASFVQNAGIKGICLCCALLLVAYQRSQEDERTRTVAFNLDAQLPSPAKHRELMTTLPPNVRVTLQGSARALEQISTATPTLELDLRDGRMTHVRLAPELFELPPGVRVKLIDPASLDLDWQDVVRREVPIQSSVTGSVAEGHEVSKVTVDPEIVELSGPQGVLRLTQYVRTAGFDVTGLTVGTYRRTLALDPPPSRTSYPDRASATVTVEVQRRLVATHYPRLALEIVGASGAVATPSKVDVTVKGPPEVIRGLSADLILPRIDLSKLDLGKHGSAILPVVVELTNATAEVQPPSVKVAW